ncbi:hypothetical protein K438DRAFT_2017733 [Mycena galopus ATCC 62051]|nr:hypothetical protein K438DRAFT_2017733 [Mycena galopus ATCC 62051]
MSFSELLDLIRNPAVTLLPTTVFSLSSKTRMSSTQVTGSSNNNGGQNHDYPGTPLRTIMACAFCSSPTHKLECDGQRPDCSNCRRLNIPCKYTPTTGTAEEESSASQDLTPPTTSMPNVTGGIDGEAGRATAGGQPGEGGRGGAPDIEFDPEAQWGSTKVRGGRGGRGGDAHGAGRAGGAALAKLRYSRNKT